jgi:hypothetical protein
MGSRGKKKKLSAVSMNNLPIWFSQRTSGGVHDAPQECLPKSDRTALIESP